MSERDIKLLFALAKIKLKQNDNITDINGVSMEPLIFQGENIKVEERPSYKIGDIIVFVDFKCALLVHRIIGIQDDVFITKGDNTVAAEKCSRHTCIGLVTSIYYKSKDGSSKEIYPYKPFWDRMIALLSKRINKKFLKGYPAEGLFKSRKRNAIKKIVALFYRDY